MDAVVARSSRWDEAPLLGNGDRSQRQLASLARHDTMELSLLPNVYLRKEFRSLLLLKQSDC